MKGTLILITCVAVATVLAFIAVLVIVAAILPSV